MKKNANSIRGKGSIKTRGESTSKKEQRQKGGGEGTTRPSCRGKRGKIKKKLGSQKKKKKKGGSAHLAGRKGVGKITGNAAIGKKKKKRRGLQGEGKLGGGKRGEQGSGGRRKGTKKKLKVPVQGSTGQGRWADPKFSGGLERKAGEQLKTASGNKRKRGKKGVELILNLEKKRGMKRANSIKERKGARK